jgi:hypothetical protein
MVVDQPIPDFLVLPESFDPRNEVALVKPIEAEAAGKCDNLVLRVCPERSCGIA